MTEVMANPKLLATLLQKAKTEPEKLKLSKRLGQLFTEAGFFVTGGRQTIIRGAPSAIRAIETEEYDPISQDETIGDQSSVEPSVQEGIPTTQVASSQPFLSGLNTAPAGGGGSSAASAPTDRTKYASLFPDDIVSGMIPTATMAEGGEVKYMRNGGSMDMGLETDVAAQESIQDSLENTGNDDNTSFSFSPSMLTTALDRIRSIPTTFQQNLNYNTPNAFAGLPSLNVGGFNVGLGPVGGNLGITATKTFRNGGPVQNFFSGGEIDSYVDDRSNEDAFGPSEEFGSDVSEESKAENRYDDPSESMGDMYSLSPDLFNAMRGATKTNPFPNSLPSRIANFFGTNVDYTNQYGGGSKGEQRIAEINQLRQAQALYPEDYTMKDFYEGQPTVRGPAVDVSNPITQGIRMLAPYGSGQIIPGDFLPQEIAEERGLTARQRKLLDLNIFNRLFGR